MRTHTVDVADRQSVRQLIEWMTEQLGRIDILVNSAGVNIVKRTMVEMSPDDWDKVMAINATGAYNCIYAVLPQMRARKDGLIINVSSIAGKRAAALGGVAYCASKFAMTGLGTRDQQRAGRRRDSRDQSLPRRSRYADSGKSPHARHGRASREILQPDDFADIAVAIAALPPRANVPEIILKPTLQGYV